MGIIAREWKKLSQRIEIDAWTDRGTDTQTSLENFRKGF